MRHEAQDIGDFQKILVQIVYIYYNGSIMSNIYRSCSRRLKKMKFCILNDGMFGVIRKSII